MADIPLSPQDVTDLRQIRSQLPNDHPSAGKIDTLLQSAGPMPAKSPVLVESSLGDKAMGALSQVGDWAKSKFVTPAVEGAKDLAEDVTHTPSENRAKYEKRFAGVAPPKAVGEPAIPPALMPSMIGGAGINAVKAIPTPGEVGNMFEVVEDAAKAAGQRVPLGEKTMSAIERAKEIKTNAGTTIPTPMRTMARNITPSRLNPGPIAAPSFRAARDVYAPTTKLAAEDVSKLTGPMKSVNNQFRAALDSDLRSAAQAIGHGETYENAMKLYPAAMRVQALKDATPTVLGKIAKYGIGALGAGAAGKLGYEIAQGLK